MSDWTITGFKGINNMSSLSELDQPSVTKTGNYGDVELSRCINFDIDNNNDLVKRNDEQAIFTKEYDAKLIAVLAGRTYTAVGRLLRYTKPYLSEYDATRSYIEYPAPIVLIVAVETGMWVSTTEKIYFHSGRNPAEIGGFSVTGEYDFPAIMGTGEKVEAGRLGLDNDGFVAIFATVRGICYGTQTGMLNNISESVFSYKVGERGISIVEEHNGLVQYKVKMINPDPESYNKHEPTTKIEVDSL